MKRRPRVRLHLVGDLGSVEGLLVTNRWTVAAHYKLVDVAFLETRTDKHTLDSLATYVPRENVRFFEVLK